MNEQALREAIARRAAELGGNVRPRDLELETREIAPGWMIFRARWQPENALSGALYGESLDLLPARALGRMFRELSFRSADAMAELASWMYDPLGMRTVSDAEPLENGVAFTWNGTERVRVTLNERGEAIIT